MTVGRSNSALGAFYRRLGARIGKAKAVTATARKIAVLFYNTMRFGMTYQDPGADRYEREYRDRVVKNLHRRAAEFGFSLQPAGMFFRKLRRTSRGDRGEVRLGGSTPRPVCDYTNVPTVERLSHRATASGEAEHPVRAALPTRCWMCRLLRFTRKAVAVTGGSG